MTTKYSFWTRARAVAASMLCKPLVIKAIILFDLAINGSLRGHNEMIEARQMFCDALENESSQCMEGCLLDYLQQYSLYLFSPSYHI